MLKLILLTRTWRAAWDRDTQSTKTWFVCAPLTSPTGATGLGRAAQVALEFPGRGTSPCPQYWHRSVHRAQLVWHPGTWGTGTALFLALLQIITL